MKKLLLGSTALIGAAAFTAPALAEDHLAVDFSGVINYRYAYADDGGASGTNDLDGGGDIYADGVDLTWTATYETDGGLSYGGVIDLGNGDLSVDEAYLFFQGDWGTVEIGDNDGARSMVYGGEAALSGTTGYDGAALRNVNAPTDFGAPTDPSTEGNTGDASKITYMTPSFSGFAAGVSYTPRAGDIGVSNLDANNSDIIELGLAFENTFDGFTIGLNAGYRSADQATENMEDISAYEIGGKVGYAGFTLAAGYGDGDDSGDTKGTEKDFWSIGLGYDFGPGSVSIGYFESSYDDNNSATADDEYEVFTIGGDYDILEGLNTYAEVNFNDIDTDGTANDVDATTFIIGTKLSF